MLHDSHPRSDRSSQTRLAACFDRAVEMADHGDYAYASELLAECVLADPANLEFVEALLRNLGHASRAKRGPLRLSKPFRFTAFSRAVSHRQWDQVLRLGVHRLLVEPGHVATLRGMATACEELHFNEAALAYLREALDAAPKDADVSRHCARSLTRMGQFDQAIACWHRVEEIKGKDPEAARMIGKLAEERMKYPGGKPSPAANGADSARDGDAKSAEAEA
ncbi:MAG: tetratricopeptide repeat protein, partial [Planctomycetota bacterium]